MVNQWLRPSVSEKAQIYVQPVFIYGDRAMSQPAFIYRDRSMSQPVFLNRDSSMSSLCLCTGTDLCSNVCFLHGQQSRTRWGPAASGPSFVDLDVGGWTKLWPPRCLSFRYPIHHPNCKRLRRTRLWHRERLPVQFLNVRQREGRGPDTETGGPWRGAN